VAFGAARCPHLDAERQRYRGNTSRRPDDTIDPLEADGAGAALAATRWIHDRFDELRREVAAGSRHAELIDMHHQIAGNLLFLRFEFTTGDAAGHNMTTRQPTSSSP